MTTSKVRVSVGMTLNLGNYNSARVAIEIENEVNQPGHGVTDLDSNQTMIQATYNQAEQELVDKLTQLLARLEREGFLPDD